MKEILEKIIFEASKAKNLSEQSFGRIKREHMRELNIHGLPSNINLISVYQKLLKNEMNIDKIYDLVALRILVKDVASCYKTLGIIHKHWRPLPQKIQDFIALPRPNGYQGLHTTVFCLEGKLTEFQIKTKEMHEEAEYGIAAHWRYKEESGLRKKQTAWIKQLLNIQKIIKTRVTETGY